MTTRMSLADMCKDIDNVACLLGKSVLNGTFQCHQGENFTAPSGCSESHVCHVPELKWTCV